MGRAGGPRERRKKRRTAVKLAAVEGDASSFQLIPGVGNLKFGARSSITPRNRLQLTSEHVRRHVEPWPIPSLHSHLEQPGSNHTTYHVQVCSARLGIPNAIPNAITETSASQFGSPPHPLKVIPAASES